MTNILDINDHFNQTDHNSVILSYSCSPDKDSSNRYTHSIQISIKIIFFSYQVFIIYPIKYGLSTPNLKMIINRPSNKQEKKTQQIKHA